MGLFEKIFPKTSVNQVTDGYFQTLNAYTPTFRSFSGGIYEAELCRKCIHTFATHASRLHLDTYGKAGDKLDGLFAYGPNPWQTTSQFLYKLATVLETENTAFIIPLLDPTGKYVNGVYAAATGFTEILDYNGTPYVRFIFPTGKATVELSKVGIMTKYQYKDDFYGGDDHTLGPTLDMIETINQGITEGVKSSANIRFLARIAQVVKPETLEQQRKKFVQNNLSASNNGGVIMYDGLIDDVKQIDSKPLIVDAEQMKIIQASVYSHFGTNENILTNTFTEEQWNSYYNGKIEPFAAQLSGVLQRMFLTEKDVLDGSGIIASDSRLDHSTNATKVTMVTSLFDRGMMTQNEGRKVFGLGEVEDGDKFYIRKEYTETENLDKEATDAGQA